MLCSICKKNTAVIFTNTVIDGKPALEGICYACAKEKGINPLEMLAKQASLSEEELEDMSKQMGDLFEDLTQNEEVSNSPISSLLSSVFGGKNANTESAPNEKKKVKVSAAARPVKKKRALDTFRYKPNRKSKSWKIRCGHTVATEKLNA